jgi:hypothetical protein
MISKTHCKHCPRCGNKLRTVNVHGHEECVECHQVVDDCCQGEVCQPTFGAQEGKNENNL